MALIDSYLRVVLEEAEKRGYQFDVGKIGSEFSPAQLSVTEGQLRLELEHLKRKLRVRDLERYKSLENIDLPTANPIFTVVEGDVQAWEKAG